MTTTKGTDTSLAAAVDTAGGATPPGIATGYEGSIADQLRAYVQRVRGGEMGMLPAIAGLIVLTILFTALSPYFLTRLNIANLFTQSASLAVLAVALVFVILLGEIDLSAGVTAGVGMGAFILLDSVANWSVSPSARSSGTSSRRSGSRASWSPWACSSACPVCCSSCSATATPTGSSRPRSSRS
jgi:D-xylose transport system permease protein